MDAVLSYDRPSEAGQRDGQLVVDFATERSRRGPYIDAEVGEPLAFARALLALRGVAAADYRRSQRDHAAYQAWVRERYLEELPAELAQAAADAADLGRRRQALAAEAAPLEEAVRGEEARLREKTGAGFAAARRAYFQWLYEQDQRAWLVIDPVVSVFPDAVYFECLSADESCFGRVRVDGSLLRADAPPRLGTTNIDFGSGLARELRRVRSYRPPRLRVGREQVALATTAGEAVEKRIPLPERWPAGFLQVQAATGLAATTVRLRASLLADVVAELGRRPDDAGPRALRFELAPGEPVAVVAEPWEVRFVDHARRWDGPPETVRVWGRRRLALLRPLLADADEVTVRLVGSGMPSFWTVDHSGVRFDLGLSGWTGVDWARSDSFDLLASVGEATPRAVARVAAVLQDRGVATTEDLAAGTGLPRETVVAASVRLLRAGKAMHDASDGIHRWRELLPRAFSAEHDEADARLAAARRAVASGAVVLGAPVALGDGSRRVAATVTIGRPMETAVEIDADGQVRRAACGCADFRRNKLRHGPCRHLLATVAALARTEPAG